MEDGDNPLQLTILEDGVNHHQLITLEDGEVEPLDLPKAELVKFSEITSKA